ncbi:DNA adenine methylase [Curtobacterium sp. MCBD17_040]|uniref:DNA adenine methylase n=1 Tax=Curtobacterium sp. MCBD17_040 TaxID=2175674 RepID=UPI000DA9F609|nr:DNA adenine methylase [Curtobacterium sp. MCBD17_040]WIB65875.1 DNA adenine methylase [Curtobacterium sp. MCBD17_040]
MTSSRRYVSPLRYPGGKAAMTSWLADLFAQQTGDLPVEVWLEPFAGGAGAALTLLDRDAVNEAWLVDANPGIAAFWHTVVDDGPALAALVEQTTPTLTLYDECRALLVNPDDADRFRLGFAAFIVNRCSRSGIVAPTSGPMGGRSGAGGWSLDGRFNASALADRIRHVHGMRSRLRVHHGDGISYLEELADSGLSDEVVAFVDPPYIREGNRLYANGMDAGGHQRLADALNTSPARWVLTYDDEPVVANRLYPERRVLGYDIRNTANRARVAREYAVFSDNLDVRGLSTPLRGLNAEWVRAAARPRAA